MRFPPAPDGLTAYVIGDIHGRLDLLVEVHRLIDEDKARSGIESPVEVYLGDYVDRGPQSAGVVSTLIERATKVHTAFLRGNHEQMLLEFLNGNDCWRLWSAVGAVPTLLSYGADANLLSRMVADAVIRRVLNDKLPSEHRRFYEQTGSYLSMGSYLAVHAGIRPGISLERQDPKDLLTIRREFLDHESDFGPIVVHGHTPVMQPDLRRNRINLDTGAFATNRLTCLRIGPDGVGILDAGGCRIVDRP